MSPDDSIKRSTWLAVLAVTILVLGLSIRVAHSVEIPAGVMYETEAAFRMQLSQCPYTDFYFDQLMPVVGWRMVSLALAAVVALLSGTPSNLIDCMVDPKSLGLASVILTAALTVFSFSFNFVLINRFAGRLIDDRQKWLWLGAFALASLAVGFEFGEQQHLFVLLSLPYLLCRWLELEGAAVGNRFRFLAAIMAALGASFSVFYLLVLVAFEAVEMLARRRFRSAFSRTSLCFFSVYILISLSNLLLPIEAQRSFRTWILPIRFNELTHDSYAFYGSYVTPERKSLLYAAVFVLVLAFGGLRRLQILRPLAALTILGLMVWMSLVLGLSADAVILTFFAAMLFVLEAYHGIQWFVFRYPRLFRRRKEAAVTILYATTMALACAFMIGSEVQQRKLVKTGPTRLASALSGNVPDLADVIKDNTKEGSRVLILNGRVRPMFPLLALCKRRTCGYFLGTEVLGTLSNIRTRHYFDTDFGTPESLTSAAEKDLYARLSRDIVEQSPALICVEGGEIEEALALFKVQPLIMQKYKRLCEAIYYSDRQGPREITDVGYNYWIYKLR
ncbi:MAG: hypothetical protein JSS83_00950 [Cyanobacteria bacterium SZAS LIN-3]|nr:hypothetical protein [Cyanobacteria bacterium SZAS LIN-3]